jgi:hypothetical protein
MAEVTGFVRSAHSRTLSRSSFARKQGGNRHGARVIYVDRNEHDGLG